MKDLQEFGILYFNLSLLGVRGGEGRHAAGATKAAAAREAFAMPAAVTCKCERDE